jgi:hypothetical protein
MRIVLRPAAATPSEAVRLGWHGSAVVAGSRRGRAVLAADLTSAGWDVVATSDLNLALYHVRHLQPDLVAVELRLARAGHRARLASPTVLAPSAMFVTFAADGEEVGPGELADLGVWSHLAGPQPLPFGQLLERLHVAFALALRGVDVAIPGGTRS